MNKKKLMQIIVPLAIALVIGGIWWAKNAETRREEESRIQTDNADFALEATELDLEALAEYGLPIIVDFGADWCPPCRAFFPILKAAHAAHLEQAIIKYVDTEKSPDIAAQYPVSSIPTQILIGADGKPYEPSEELLKTGISFQYYQARDTGEHVLTVHEGMLTEQQLAAVLEDMGVGQ